MRSNTTSSPARRQLRAAERRSRRRPAIIAAGLAFGLVAAAGASVTLPASQAQAQASVTSQGFVLASYSAPLQPIVADATVDATSADARDALAAAEESITAAATIGTDIEESGLDVGVDDTTVDTGDLESAVDRLSLADRLPAELVPAFIDEVTELVAEVEADVNGLRGSLDAAIALKAEQEAAAKAKAEAEAAAAAAAAEAAAEAAAAAAQRSPPHPPSAAARRSSRVPARARAKPRPSPAT